jgi:hypothetical protein
MPEGRGNIDHIALGASGVTVIDAKRYRGRIAVEHRGGFLRTRTEHLRIGGREQTTRRSRMRSASRALHCAATRSPRIRVFDANLSAGEPRHLQVLYAGDRLEPVTFGL